jgi:hypothetical protein
MSATPPREWFEKQGFVDEQGMVRYCSVCKAIPFVFIGHSCTSLEARARGCAGEIIEAPYRWERVIPVENEDRPGDWMLIWVGE